MADEEAPRRDAPEAETEEAVHMRQHRHASFCILLPAILSIISLIIFASLLVRICHPRARTIARGDPKKKQPLRAQARHRPLFVSCTHVRSSPSGRRSRNWITE